MLSYHNLREVLRISYLLNLTYIFEKTKGSTNILLSGSRALAGKAEGKRNPWYLNHKDGADDDAREGGREPPGAAPPGFLRFTSWLSTPPSLS